MKTVIIAFRIALLFTLTIVVHKASGQTWALDTVVSTGTNTSGIAITSDGSKLVVSNNTKPGKIKIISTSDYAISSIDISSIEDYPNAVAIAPNDSMAYICTTHKIVMISIINKATAGSYSVPCVGTTLYGLAVSPDGKNVLFPDLSSSCTSQGLRTMDNKGSSSTFNKISTSGELYGIAITPNGTTALITGFSPGGVPKKVNLWTYGITDISGITSSYGVAMLHNGKEALIYDGDSVDRVSLATNSVTKKISSLSYTGSFQNIAITSDDKYAFIVGAFDKLVISLADNTVVQSFSAGGTNVATNSDGSKFYVTDSYNGTVRVYKKSTTSGITENIQGLNKVSIYPNPATDFLTLSSANKLQGKYEIINPLGQIIKSGILQNEISNQINIHDLHSGIYFINISNPDGIVRLKFIKE